MTNTTITLDHPAERIITTSTYATEYLIVINAGDRIIGAKEDVLNDPLFKSHLTHAVAVGGSDAPDFEKIVSLNPDIILMPGETSATIKEKFRKTNLTVAYFNYYSPETLTNTIQAMGVLTGNPDEAREYLEFYQKYDDIVTERLQNISPNQEITIYYEMSGDYNTAGKGSGGYNYLKKLHMKNIAEDLPGNYPTVSAEWIIDNDPDVITKNGLPTDNLSNRYYDLVTRSGLSNLSAIRNNRTYLVSSNILYGPRNIIGLIYLAKISYPERFQDIEPESVLDDYAESFFTGANITETVYPELNTLNYSGQHDRNWRNDQACCTVIEK